jgi:hypothetical protein
MDEGSANGGETQSAADIRIAGTQSAPAGPAGGLRDIRRIGGGSVDNLRLKPAETKLRPPGISVLKAPTAEEAAQQMVDAFPNATSLHELAKTVGSTTEELIQSTGFALLPDPTRKFPNHYRLTHPDGISGFSDENLARLSHMFNNVTRG